MSNVFLLNSKFISQAISHLNIEIYNKPVSWHTIYVKSLFFSIRKLLEFMVCTINALIGIEKLLVNKSYNISIVTDCILKFPALGIKPKGGCLR